MTDLLPIGSLVKLKNNQTAVIIGYLPNKPNDKKIYDYICTRKNGFVVSDDGSELNEDYFYIEKDEIDKILYIGFYDEESN